MDEQGFREHLDDVLPTEDADDKQHNINENVRKVIQIEDGLGLNLIRQGQEGRRQIHTNLRHGQAMLHANQASMGWTLDTPRNTISPVRSALKAYCAFCQDPPIDD